MDAPANEKRERFIRLAERRTNAVIKRIRILSNCSNANVYEYADADIDQIFAAIEEELNRAKAKFATTRDREFRLTANVDNPARGLSAPADRAEQAVRAPAALPREEVGD